MCSVSCIYAPRNCTRADVDGINSFGETVVIRRKRHSREEYDSMRACGSEIPLAFKKEREKRERMDRWHNVFTRVHGMWRKVGRTVERSVGTYVSTDTYARVMAHVRPTRVRQQQQLKDLNRATQGRIHPFIARSYFLPGTWLLCQLHIFPVPLSRPMVGSFPSSFRAISMNAFVQNDILCSIVYKDGERGYDFKTVIFIRKKNIYVYIARDRHFR